jgi:hypothetical protein
MIILQSGLFRPKNWLLFRLGYGARIILKGKFPQARIILKMLAGVSSGKDNIKMDRGSPDFPRIILKWKTFRGKDIIKNVGGRQG